MQGICVNLLLLAPTLQGADALTFRDTGFLNGNGVADVSERGPVASGGYKQWANHDVVAPQTSCVMAFDGRTVYAECTKASNGACTLLKAMNCQ